MASYGRVLLATLLLLLLAETAYGGILLSSLPNTLSVFAAAQRPGRGTYAYIVAYMQLTIFHADRALFTKSFFNSST